MAVAQGAQPLEEAVRRDDHATVPLDRFDEDCGRCADSRRSVLERRGDELEYLPSRPLGLPELPSVWIGVREEMRICVDADAGPEGGLAVEPGDSRRAAEVATGEGDDVVATGR